MSTSANYGQVGGVHYRGADYQHWDLVAHNRLDYFQGCSTKYLFRWPKKNGKEDIFKARHFIVKLAELAASGYVNPADPDVNTLIQATKSNGVGPLETAVCWIVCSWKVPDDLTMAIELIDQLLAAEFPQKVPMPPPPTLIDTDRN